MAIKNKRGFIKTYHFFRISVLLLAFFPAIFTACIDNSGVEYNTYTITNITPPVDKQGTAQEKKVYIGHSLPVNVTLEAEYAESNIPLQFYLLNVDDVRDVEEGIVYVDDIRIYYCHQTENTEIEQIDAGANTYGVVINIPASQSKDEYTDDFKVGTYYVLAEVDKNDEAEIDVYEVYEKFKDKLDEENTIVIASDYMSKPDLSVNGMNFTGTTDDPRDSLIFYDLDLSELPGAESANLGIMHLKPTVSACAFTGSVNVKSSSNDSLNVPVVFYLTHDDWKDDERIPLEIYDEDMSGFIEEFYIPILRKNTEENINLQLRVPDDSGTINYFTDFDESSTEYTAWEDESNKEDYPLFKLRYKMSQMEPDSEEDGKKYYQFKLVSEVNPNGSVTESRFIKANDDNSVYTEDDYKQDGDVYDKDNTTPVSTKENNIFEEEIILAVETIEVKPNEGTQFYPCSAVDINGDGDIDDDDCAYDLEERKFVIWWGGWGASFGKDSLGGSLDAHAGMFFSNYSLLSVGAHFELHIGDFITDSDKFTADGGYKLNLNAESHPFDADKSYYEFLVAGWYSLTIGDFTIGYQNEWGDDEDWWQGEFNLLSFKDDAKGFGEYDLETPVTFSKTDFSFETKVLGIGVDITIRSGLQGLYIIPRTKIDINRDGSLRYDSGLYVGWGIEAEASVGAFDLINAGIEGGIELFAFDFGIGFFTNTFYNQSTHPGEVRGSLGIGPEIWFTGPQGYLKLFFDITVFFLADIRIELPLLSFQAFNFKIYDEPFTESGKTNWVDVEDANKIDYTVLEEDNESR